MFFAVFLSSYMLVSMGTGFLGPGANKGFLGLDTVQIFRVLLAHGEVILF